MPSDGKSSHYLWQGGLKKVTKNKIATEAGEKSTKNVIQLMNHHNFEGQYIRFELKFLSTFINSRCVYF